MKQSEHYLMILLSNLNIYQYAFVTIRLIVTRTTCFNMTMIIGCLLFLLDIGEYLLVSFSLTFFNKFLFLSFTSNFVNVYFHFCKNNLKVKSIQTNHSRIMKGVNLYIAAFGCPPGWTPFNTSCYHLSLDKKSWIDGMVSVI